MLRVARAVWSLIPYSMRLRLIRLTQKRFTASVVAIVRDRKGRILILDHAIRPGATLGLPGGFLEPDEDPYEAISRELKEETTLTLENVELRRIRTIRKHIEILFVADGVGDAVISSREIVGLGWYSPDDVPEKMSLIQKRLVEVHILKPESAPSDPEDA